MVNIKLKVVIWETLTSENLPYIFGFRKLPYLKFYKLLGIFSGKDFWPII